MDSAGSELKLYFLPSFLFVVRVSPSLVLIQIFDCAARRLSCASQRTRSYRVGRFPNWNHRTSSSLSLSRTPRVHAAHPFCQCVSLTGGSIGRCHDVDRHALECNSSDYDRREPTTQTRRREGTMLCRRRFLGRCHPGERKRSETARERGGQGFQEFLV